jgi:hypothetical protein
MNTDTPRTDEAAVDVWRKSNGERMATSSDKVDADFARCLERELNEARFDLDFSRRLADWQSKTIDDLTAQRDEAREESIRWQSFAEGRGRTDDEIENDTQCELAAWELLREAQAENIGWQNKWQVAVEMAALAQNELAAVTAQRDEARDEAIRTREFMDYGFSKAQEELTDMTAQRDRLAEALLELRNNESFSLGGAVNEIVEQALQSLPPKP